MDTKTLVFAGETEPKLYACGRCGTLQSPKSGQHRDAKIGNHLSAKIASDECCAPDHCLGCGREVRRYTTYCEACWERKKIRRAVLIEPNDYAGPVFTDRVAGDWEDGFSSDIDALAEHCEEWDDPVPAWCWPCHEEHLQINSDSMIDSIASNMHESASDEVVDEQELHDFIAAWNKKQTCRSYYPDFSRVIVLDRDRLNAFLDGPRGHGRRRGLDGGSEQ